MAPHFIIRLNRVDLITLTGLALVGGVLWLIQAGHLTAALALLYAAMLADALDGYLARKWGLTREFGRYLDGFVDTFMYLVTPAFWAWQWGFNGPTAMLIIYALWACGSVRLAVFNQTGNIRQGKALAYQGMPVYWIVFSLSATVILSWWLGRETALALLHGLWALVALCMVWNRPFFKFNTLGQILTVVLSGILIFGTRAWWEANHG